jgi:hypothetical protein
MNSPENNNPAPMQAFEDARAEKLRQREEMLKQAECQYRLAVDYYKEINKLEDVDEIPRNDILNAWSDSDYSESFRALVTEMQAELKKGESIDYLTITLEQVREMEKKLKEAGKFKRNK